MILTYSLLHAIKQNVWFDYLFKLFTYFFSIGAVVYTDIRTGTQQN